MYPNVSNEWATISLLSDSNRSIARYGDGELKICRGASAKAQSYDENLSRRLQEILISDNPNCLIGIPRIHPQTELPEQKRLFWRQYDQERYTRYYDLKKLYVSSFVTRPDSIPAINTPEYFNHVQKLWFDRDVILINGDNKCFDRDPGILANARSYERWEIPSANAWSIYELLLAACKLQDREKLFILAGGPMATVLAYDLSLEGYQALDLGHFGMFYARLRRGESPSKSECPPYMLE
jgi:glycosyltransferase family protein